MLMRNILFSEWVYVFYVCGAGAVVCAVSDAGAVVCACAAVVCVVCAACDAAGDGAGAVSVPPCLLPLISFSRFLFLLHLLLLLFYFFFCFYCIVYHNLNLSFNFLFTFFLCIRETVRRWIECCWAVQFFYYVS